MKVTCNREALLSGFQIAASVAPVRSTRAILSSVKFEIDSKETGTLLATDLEMGVRYKVAGLDASEPFSVVLPVTQVMSILRELTDEMVEIAQTTGGLTLRGAKSRFELQSEEVDQFPDIPRIETESAHRIKAGVLANLIRRTIFACANENSRYALHSVLLEFSEGEVRFISTDSKRLAVMSGPMESLGESTAGQWLIPPKALQLLARALDDPEQIIEFVLHDNEALFQALPLTIYTRLVEGRFPKYQDVIPSEIKHRVPLQTGPFHSVVRQSRIVTNEESRGVDFTFADGELVLTSQAAQLGESEIKLPIGYSGEPLTVTYDPQLLMDALKILDPADEITLEISDVRRASVFRTQDGFQYVVMPLLRER